MVAMDDILERIREWVGGGHAVAVATVVSTWGSSPRAVGARMAVRDDGAMAGSVSGGCVEGAVVQEALEVLQGGSPRLLQYGVSDETAWDVGLACGGSIEVFIQPQNPDLIHVMAERFSNRQALCQSMVIAGPDSLIGRSAIFNEGGLIAGDWQGELLAETKSIIAETLASGVPGRIQVELANQPLEIFIDALLPSATLIMIGGVHISIALSSLAKVMGFRTVVIDPRKSFATDERFPEIDQLIRSWPKEGLVKVGVDANTAVAVLTHDPKIDDPALLEALRSSAFYVGALGSRATHARRVERLRKEGITDEELSRLKAPIGLDLGGRTPQEIAVSILAEITATRYGKQIEAG